MHCQQIQQKTQTKVEIVKIQITQKAAFNSQISCIHLQQYKIKTSLLLQLLWQVNHLIKRLIKCKSKSKPTTTINTKTQTTEQFLSIKINQLMLCLKANTSNLLRHSQHLAFLVEDPHLKSNWTKTSFKITQGLREESLTILSSLLFHYLPSNQYTKLSKICPKFHHLLRLWIHTIIV